MKEYNKLINAIDEVHKKLFYNQEIEFTGGPVSVSDLISYQIGWGTLLISLLQGKNGHLVNGFKSIQLLTINEFLL